MTENVQIFMEKDRLQPLADNIKVLKGSDSITLQQMEDTIEETNTDIVSQTDLIAQLASALQGKSVSGGGDGSTPAYETCTVRLENDDMSTSYCFYALENGTPVLRSLCFPMTLNEELSEMLSAGYGLDKVIVGSTLLCMPGLTYTDTKRTGSLEGECEALCTVDGNTFVQKGNTAGIPILINGDCTIRLPKSIT